ncbi:unnamed protein product, partial [Mesorhabditis spiculigera]
MDLTVNVFGEQQTLSGLTENTTCEEVIYTLAHSIGRPGRYVLLEKQDRESRPLLPSDRLIHVLGNLKDQKKDISFHLERIENNENITGMPAAAPPLPHTVSESRFYGRMPPISNTAQKAFPMSGPSTASLPAYPGVIMRPGSSLGAIHNRAPPPDYAHVMEKRFNSLSRNTPVNRPPLTNACFEPMHPSTASMPYEELERLIEANNVILEQQRRRIYQLDLDAQEDSRELMQLERQRENLEEVLRPLREANWPQRYDAAYTNAIRLKSAIERTKGAIKDIQRDIEVKMREEAQLQQQLFEGMRLEDLPANQPAQTIHQGMKAF